MRIIARVRHLWRNIFQRRAVERDLGDELESYVGLLAAEHVRAGMTPAAATRAARIEAASAESTKEAVREVRVGAVADTLVRDARFAIRSLARNPGFTAVAVAALALGIGANTAILSVVNGILLRPLAYKDPAQLVVILHNGRNPVAPANYLDWKNANHTFSQMGAADYWTASLTGGGDAEKVWALKLTASVLPMLGVQPLVGHLWSPSDDEPGRDHQVVLSYRLWQRRFAGNRDVVNTPVMIDGDAFTIIGVMPPDFAFAPFWATKAELWAPLALGDRKTSRNGQSLRVFARIKPGTTLEQARADMAGITARLEQQFPGTNRDVQVISLTERVVGAVHTPLLILMGAVAFVLLIACANVAHMLLARSASRRRELALRTALGATRARVVRQLLTESIMLAVAGGAAGVVLSMLGIRLLIALGASSIPRVAGVSIDGRVLGVTLVISLVTGVVFGLAPALRASSADVSTSLREGERGSTEGGRRNRLRNVLVASEFALALILLIGAGLMIRSVVALQALDPGFNPHGVLTAVVSVTGSAESPAGRRGAFYEAVLARVRGIPGVESASAVNHLALAGDVWGWPYRTEGSAPPDPGQSPAAAYRVVLPGYFRTMGIPLVAGRDISDDDRADTPPVVVVNEFLASTRWPGENPLGKRITFDGSKTNPVWVTVVGVARNDMRGEWDAKPDEEIFLPFQQSTDYLGNTSSNYAYMTLVLRARCAPANGPCDSAPLAPAVRAAVRQLDPDVPLSEVQTMDQVVATSTSRPRFFLVLLGVFAGVAVSLATLGVYGVVTYSVSRRTHEIGLRVALGAAPRSVLAQIVRESMTVIAFGAIAGLLGAFALTRLMSGLLFGVSAVDPLTFAATTALLTTIALAATCIPAFRAATIEPLVALRSA